MKRNLKIAIFSGSIPSTTFIEHLINGVISKYNVYLFGTIEQPYQYNSAKIKVYATPKSHIKNLFISSYRVLLLMIKSPRALYMLLKEIGKYPKVFDKWIWFTKFLPIVLYKPDILHLQWARDIPFYFFLKEVINCKITLSLLGSHINYSPIIDANLSRQYKELFPHVDAFHAVSESIKLETLKYGADITKIRVIRSPIQPTTFTYFKPIIRSNSKPLKLLSVGRHHWVKGYTYAVGAMEILKERGLKFSYDIIAQGAIPEELILQRDQLLLQDNVNFLNGVSPQSKLFQLMQNYDVLLLSSLSEGIANVVLEAMALGIPVISTDCGGMAEVVIPGETGWLVPVRDPQAFADAVITLQKTSQQELQRITQNAHNFVTTHFNADERIKEFLEWYEGVVVSI